ncbi:MAG: DUF4783 domain-containing protein [Bacteroidota bacterium]
MRIFCTIFAFMLLISLGTGEAKAQSRSQTLNAVVKAIQTGNSNLLASYFSSRVELTIVNQRNLYSPQQAKFVMREFFGTYPPSSFNIKHTGNTGSTTYALGSFISSRGSFEVNIFIKSEGSGYRVSNIRIGR